MKGPAQPHNQPPISPQDQEEQQQQSEAEAYAQTFTTNTQTPSLVYDPKSAIVCSGSFSPPPGFQKSKPDAS